VNRLARTGCLLIASLLAGQATAATKQEELDNLRERIRSMQADMDKTLAAKSEVADALRDSERAISDSNRRLGELTEQQHVARQELRELEFRSGKLGSELAGQRTLLGRLLYQHYVGGQHDYLYLLLNGRDPNQIARSIRYYEYLAKDRAELLGRMRTDLAQLSEVTEEARQKHEEVQALQQEEQLQKRQLERRRNEREQTMVKVAAQLRLQRTEIERMQQNEAHLSQLIERLRKLSSKPKSTKKPKSSAKQPKPQDEHAPGGDFAKLRGRLSMPVKGKPTNRFGATRLEGALWKGWFLRAASGSGVKAVADGQVVYADWMRGFGNLLIIDHGEGYMSLYGNNETLLKQVGDTLNKGDTVAAVGNSGGNETSGLYFELRHEGKPLDPGPWIAGK